MKIGDKVKVLKSTSGLHGSYSGSPPWKDELVEITEQNINDIENHLRAGNMVMFEESKTVTKYLNETPDILSDASTVASPRGRKRYPKSDDPEGA